MTERPSGDEPATTDESTAPTPAGAEPPDGFAVEFTPEREPRRRVRYEPRTDADGWWRITHEWTGCTWRIIGREPLTDACCTGVNHA